jgi:putative CocE/NonD family hydrolase
MIEMSGVGQHKRYPVRAPVTASMHARDGARLDADIYRPDGTGDFPILLMRQPYGRAVASTVTFAHPTWYASHGYVVAIQDVRGRGTSEGDFRPLRDDVDDGADTIAWVRGLPGTTGRVGMYGFSYQAMTQYMALVAAPPGLEAICPAMGPWDVYRQMVTENGAFAQGRMVSWGVQMGGIGARRVGDKDAFAAFVAASRNLPFDEGLSANPDILKRFDRYTHYHDWWEHAGDPSFWDVMSPKHRMGGQQVRTAVLHVGGWHDPYVLGTIEAFRDIARRSNPNQQLVIGPWTHLTWGRRVGAMDYGAEGASQIDAQQLLWFNRFLKDEDNGIDRELPIQLFDLTTKTWKSFRAWPASPTTKLYLGGDGRAASASNGVLLNEPAAEAAAETLVHDPWRPVQAIGGHNGRPEGMQDRASVDARADVACFTSTPLQQDLLLAGEVQLEIHIESPRPSFDISAVLSRMTPDGRVLTLTQGYATITTDMAGTPFVLSLRAICATIQKGDALRLSIAGAAFPAFPVNPGTGTHPAHAHVIEHEVTAITIRHGKCCASILSLPAHDAERRA